MPERFSYPEVGGTGRATMPAGYHHLERSVPVGRGPDDLARAGEVLTSWQMHRAAGIRIPIGTPAATAGLDVRLFLGVGPLGVSAPCRVVALVEEDRRRGFVYGTLPGHPECGEESFVAELDDDGTLRFTIRAFSRPATLLTRAGGPLGRLAQTVITRRYLNAVRRLTSS